MQRFPQAFLDTIRERADIVTLIQPYVPLRKAGRDFMGLCPFHNEKSPSFTVSPTKQFYHCFGCGAHGTAFDWLTEHAGYSFPEAVAELAQSAGIPMPEREAPTPADLQFQARHAHLQGLVAAASTIFQRQLRATPQAKEYLQGRGMTGHTAKAFAIGYASDDLIAHFPGVKLEDLVDVGLIVERPHGEIVDKFRRRIMFPIQNEAGAVIGFGGRALGNEEPKYLNSPESAIFHKGRELYGLAQAKQEIRRTRTAFVMEGYMDVVALHQHGEGRAVAALGTSITTDQLQRLFQLADHVVFAMDGDGAGQKAANRAALLALEVIGDRKTASFVTLPAEHDPDSFVRANGLDAWTEYVGTHAEPLSARVTKILTTGRDLNLPENRAAIARDASEMLATIRHAPTLQEALRTHVEGLINMGVARKVGHRSRDAKPTAEDIGTKTKPPAADRSRAAFYENLARLCQLAPQHVEQVPAVLIDDFAALICSWFAVAPTDLQARAAAVERITIPALQQVVRTAVVGTMQRAAELGAAQADTEIAAILAALQRDVEHAARVQKTTALFAAAV